MSTNNNSSRLEYVVNLNDDNNQQNNNNNGNNQQRNKSAIYANGITEDSSLAWEPVKYHAFGKVMRTTNRDIAIAIREFLSKTFHELKGVNVLYDLVKFQMVTELYFSPNMNQCPSNKILNLKDLTTITEPSKDNLFYRKKIIENRTMGKHYTINDETKILLSDLTYGGRSNKPDSKIWTQSHVIDEIQIPSGDQTYGPRAIETLVRVAGCFDFRRILSKLFGHVMVVGTKQYQDDQGRIRYKNISTDAAYEARYIKPVANEPFVFIMNIEQFDKNAVQELVVRENPTRPMVNGIIYY